MIPLVRGLERAPSSAVEERVAATLGALLGWHRTMEHWPSTRWRAPDATAYVSVYEDGALRGCFGYGDGEPAERLARAFLLATTDARFGGLPRDARAVAVASYVKAIAPVNGDPERAIAPGIHGLFYVRDDGRGIILLPQVARDEHLDARGLLAALARKAGVAELRTERLFLIETHDISSARSRTPKSGALEEAGRFLERLVDRSGHVDFAIDPRTGVRSRTGEMHHGRAAVVVRALEAGGRRRAAARARRWLAREIDAGLRGKLPTGWPTDAAMAAGTLALAVLAGVDVSSELARHAVVAVPWYRAQVVSALGERAPAAMYRACVADLEKTPWAPWTAIAAAARGDAGVVRRCARALRASVARSGPHAGGVGFGSLPELALTALTVEALLLDDDERSRRAVARARAFLAAWQNQPSVPRGPADPDVARGGSPLTPVHDLLRSDVTAHALLAIV